MEFKSIISKLNPLNPDNLDITNKCVLGICYTGAAVMAYAGIHYESAAMGTLAAGTAAVAGIHHYVTRRNSSCVNGD